jgi:hypothetical protein
VAEHDGRLVRFLPRFLSFAREYGFYPRACNPAAGWEKGKVERAIGYTRQSFWPLREFTDLHDVNRQARQWLSEVANQRQHRETRQRPTDRFQPAALKPLPVIPYDYRDSVELRVHKDLRLQFDGNRYCVPQRYVLYVRGKGNVQKKLLVQAAACNLALLLPKMIGAGTPRALQDVVAGLLLVLLRLPSTTRIDSEPTRRFWTAISHRSRNFGRCVLRKAVGRK